MLLGQGSLDFRLLATLELSLLQLIISVVLGKLLALQGVRGALGSQVLLFVAQINLRLLFVDDVNIVLYLL